MLYRCLPIYLAPAFFPPVCHRVTPFPVRSVEPYRSNEELAQPSRPTGCEMAHPRRWVFRGEVWIMGCESYGLGRLMWRYLPPTARTVNEAPTGGHDGSVDEIPTTPTWPPVWSHSVAARRRAVQVVTGGNAAVWKAHCAFTHGAESLKPCQSSHLSLVPIAELITRVWVNLGTSPYFEVT